MAGGDLDSAIQHCGCRGLSPGSTRACAVGKWRTVLVRQNHVGPVSRSFDTMPLLLTEADVVRCLHMDTAIAAVEAAFAASARGTAENRALPPHHRCGVGGFTFLPAAPCRHRACSASRS